MSLAQQSLDKRDGRDEPGPDELRGTRNLEEQPLPQNLSSIDQAANRLRVRTFDRAELVGRKTELSQLLDRRFGLQERVIGSK